MKHLLICILLLFSFCSLNAQKYPKKDEIFNQKTFDISLSYKGMSSSSYFDNDSKIVAILLDSTIIADSVNGTFREYTYEYKKSIFELGFHYNFNEDLTFTAYMPLSFCSSDEKFSEQYIPRNIIDTIPKVLPKSIRNQLRATTLDYINLGIDYKIWNSKEYSSKIGLDARIPFSNEEINLSNNEIQITNPFQIVPSFQIQANFQNYGLEFYSKYLFRNEKYSDQYSIGFGFILSSIPNTYLKAKIVYYGNTESIESGKTFYYNKMIYNENYLQLGGEFKFIITESFYFQFGIDASVIGTNTLNQSIYYLKFGVIL